MINKGLKSNVYSMNKKNDTVLTNFFFKMTLAAIKPSKMVHISSLSDVTLEIYSWTCLQIFISSKNETDIMIKRKNDTQLTGFIFKFGYFVSKYALMEIYS